MSFKNKKDLLDMVAQIAVTKKKKNIKKRPLTDMNIFQRRKNYQRLNLENITSELNSLIESFKNNSMI